MRRNEHWWLGHDRYHRDNGYNCDHRNHGNYCHHRDHCYDRYNVGPGNQEPSYNSR